MKPDAQGGGGPAISGRRRFTKEYRREVVQETLAPGASVAGVALKHRLNANLVFTWRRKLLPALAPAKAQSVKLLPVRVTEAAAAVPAVVVEASAANKPVRRSRVRGAIEIEVNGARLVVKGVVDGQVLRVVLEALVSR